MTRVADNLYLAHDRELLSLFTLPRPLTNPHFFYSVFNGLSIFPSLISP